MPPSLSPAAVRRGFVRALEHEAGRKPRVARVVGHPEPVKAYGLPVAKMRQVFKAKIPAVADLGLNDRLVLAKLLLASHIEEEGHCALGVLRMSVDELTPQHFATIDELLDDFCTWTEVDDFATGTGGITPVLLDRFPKETLRLHDTWSRSPNMWKRRTSVVTFTRRIAGEGRFVDETLRFCEALMRDPEDLVQKGVGWALKDTIRAGPAAKRRVLALVRRMRRDGIPSTITLYAIRDLTGADRESILSIKPTKR